MGGLVAHATRGAARADPASFARECDEEIVAARVAVAANEALFEPTAGEVMTKLVDDVFGQRRRVLGVDVPEKVVEVVADDGVEGRLLGTAGRVASGQYAREGWHGRVKSNVSAGPAMRACAGILAVGAGDRVARGWRTAANRHPRHERARARTTVVLCQRAPRAATPSAFIRTAIVA